MKKSILFLFVLCLLGGIKVSAQSPACLAAKTLTPVFNPDQTIIDSIMQVAANETWFKFPGRSDSAFIKLSTFITGFKNRINKIELYKGMSCGSLAFLSKDSLEATSDSVLQIHAGNFVSTDTLYIKATYIVNSLCPSCPNTNLVLRMQVWPLNAAPCALCTTQTGCNLVCNGNFETFNGIQNPLVNGNIMDACGWTDLTRGTCDYFHSASPNPWRSVPCNVFGNQDPVLVTGGNGYAGFSSTPVIVDDYAEIMKTKLLTPLSANTTYTVSFDLSLAELSPFNAGEVGVYFFDDPANISAAIVNSDDHANLSPTYTVNTSGLSTMGWVTYTLTYSTTATNIQWMAIGGFTNSYSPRLCTGVGPCTTYTCGTSQSAYIYIDNISVTGINNTTYTVTGCAGFPNVLTSQLNAPWSWYNGATTQSITSTYTTGSGFIVNGTTTNGCPAKETFWINGVSPDESITVTPPGAGSSIAACAGQPIVFTASGLSAPAPTYSWYNTNTGSQYLPPLAPLQGTGTTYTYTPTASPSLQYVTAFGYSPNGCGVIKTVAINIVPTPTATINTSNLSMCSTSNLIGTYTAVPQSPGVTYTWSVTINGTPVPFTPAPNGQSITVDWSSYLGSTSNAQVCLTVSAQGCASSNACVTVVPCCIPAPEYKVLSGSQDPANPTVLTTASFPGIGAANANSSVALSGYFEISGTVSFSQMRFAMGAGTRITVPSGAGLILSECHFFGCSQMWDGVYAAGGNNVVFQKRNLFEDAMNALVVQGNAQAVTVKDVFFNKCHIGVDFRTSTAASTSIVRACVFTSRNFNINTAGVNATSVYLGNSGIVLNYPTSNYTFYSSANVLPPFFASRAHIGVNIADHAGVTVGPVNASASFRNVFDNLIYGIHGLNSNVYVLNSLFIYIQEHCTGGFCLEPFQVSSCPPGTAICTGSNPAIQGPTPRTTKVGVPSTGTINYPNYFESDQYGVYNSTNRNLEARDNEFKIIDKIGIYNTLSSNYLKIGTIVLGPSNTLTVTGNKMDRAQTGVHFNDNRNAIMNISSNEFNWLNWSTTTTQQSVSGIIVNNAVVNTVGSLFINRNNIANLQKGITLTLQGYTGTGTTNRVLVSENEIRYNQLQGSTASVQHYGIGIFSCKRITVDGSNGATGQIIRVTTAASTLNNTATQRDLFNGVRIESSPESWVTDMNITNVPASIYAKGTCTLSDFWCNAFTGAYNGVYLFPNTDLSDQLNLTSPYYHAATGNQWISTNAAGSKIEGSASPAILWYYNPAGNYNPTPSANITGGITLVVADNPANACAFQTPPEDPGDPNGRFAGSEETPKKTMDLPETGTNSANARIFDDAPQLELYPAYLDSMGSEAAATYNASIVTESDVEVARKQVDEIHLRSWAQGIPYFAAEDSAYLCQLATEDPANLGNAVYSAQVMVGECYGGDESARFIDRSPETPQVIPVSRGKIYPNPNDGQMQAEFMLKDAEKGLLEILSLSGNKLSSYILNTGPNSFVIDESRLQAGIYLYRITINGSVTEIKKLIIVK
jgi:hypothetical protein